MTDQPAVGPLGAEDVKLLVKGNLLRHAVAPNVFRLLRKTSGEWPDLWLHMVGEPHTAHMADRWLFEARADPDGWIPWSSGENPVPGQRVELLLKSGITSGVYAAEEIDWADPRFRAFRLAPTAQVETLGPAAAVAADVVRGEPDDDLKLVIAHTIVEELRAQHPGIEQIDNERGDIWLPGGSTPQSSGCIVDIHSVAQAVEQQVRATFAPGHTDLMVSPESIDAFLETNPLPNTGGEVEASGAEREAVANLIKENVTGPSFTDGDLIAAQAKDRLIAADKIIAYLRPQPTAPAGEEVRDAVAWLEKAFPRTAAGFSSAYQPTMAAVHTVLAALRTTPAPSVDLAELKRLHAEAVKHLGGPNLKADSYGLQVWGESKKGGHSHVLDVRGWGELTGLGHGALGLSEDEGRAAQRARQAYLVAAWNAVPALIAQIEREEG